MSKSMIVQILTGIVFISALSVGCSSSQKTNSETPVLSPASSAPAQSPVDLGASSSGRAL